MMKNRATLLGHPRRAATASLLLLAWTGLATCGCNSARETEEKIVVTTPTGRQELATRRYTLRELEAGSAASAGQPSPFDVQHPVYPNQQQLDGLKQRL